VEQNLPNNPEGIRTAVEKIFTDQGGAAILWLGENLGKAAQKVNKTQMRKFLTELKAIREYNEFDLNRFRWICKYIAAQEKSRELELLREYLDTAAKKAAEADTENRVKRLQSLMESIYAHYLWGEVKEGR
jgi:CRISPR/Cas system CSM-associated protein Csm2 small subunit